MKTKRTPQFGSFSLQLVFCSVAVGSIITGTLLAFFHPETPAKGSDPAAAGLTFAERVAYQRAIEEVYWRHRIWPKERPGPKPSLDAMMSQTQIEKKVADYLRKSQAVEDHWQSPITPEQLQGEMDRMAKHTKQPEVLRELFEALNNDPFVVAECLARPTLAERELSAVAPQKQPLESVSGKPEAQIAKAILQPSARYTLPIISGGSGCVDNWITTAGPPDRRDGHTAVWTGSEMIIWGGFANEAYLNSGARYDPATDNWITTNATNAPTDRYAHSAVWTGTEMIVWGGYSYDGNYHWLNTGGRYEPSTDSWISTSVANAPAGRYSHPAVWTGSEMIIWGGWGTNFSELNTGGRYNPNTDSWTATSMTNVPTARILHTAVWTGSEMIVWGGFSATGGYQWFDTGGRYNPKTDTWISTNTSNAPDGRYIHTAVWTGTEMIVWGGLGDNFSYLNTGGRYNPITDSWTAVSTSSAPSARSNHITVWTGSEMIIWGGFDQSQTYSNTGGNYDPSTDSWTPTSIINAPIGRDGHTAVWTGSEMIIWGGHFYDGNDHFLNSGGRYIPVSNTWTPTATENVPDARYLQTVVWTGSEMIIWGGRDGDFFWNTGARYNPSSDAWIGISTANAPAARESHTAVWTGSEMIIWGGIDGSSNYLNAGGRYSPNTDTWTATSTTNAPSARESHTAVWTGSEMVVWGGSNGSVAVNTGGRYNPNTDTWTATSIISAPEERQGHTAVWTGSEMIIWGGWDHPNYLNTGGRSFAQNTPVPTPTPTPTVPPPIGTGERYNPSTDSWTPTSNTNAPTPRLFHTAVWTGSEMIVWGGTDNTSFFNTGGRYNPSTNSWTAISTTDAPAARARQTAVWTGSEMMVWGGQAGIYPTVYFNTGGRYNSGANTWAATSLMNAPTARSLHTAVWSGNEMIIWGGQITDRVGTGTGARYCAQFASPTPTPTATATATLPPSPTPTATATATPSATATPVSPTPTPRPAPTPRHRPSPRPRP